MKDKPELIIISLNVMGGGASFHRNMIANRPDDYFDVKCIYLDPRHWVAKRLENKLEKNDVVFEFEREPELQIAKRLNKHISNREGAVVTNLKAELIALDYFYKSKKTIFFICHDDAYLGLVKRYHYLIDVFLAHNFDVYECIQKLLPDRLNDIYFIQHGVNVQHFKRSKNETGVLKLVFLARHVKLKGIYDLPKIDDELLKRNIKVDWTILGDGEEKENFMNEVKSKQNFIFQTPETSNDVIEVLKSQDLYILPSSLDGLPVSLLESMSVGCVPIVYNFSEGIKKVITPDIGYVVDQHDIKGVAHHIEYLANNRNVLEKFSLSCTEKINKEFDIKKQAAAYFNLYKRYRELKKRRPFNRKQVINKLRTYKIFRGLFILLKRVK